MGILIISQYFSADSYLSILLKPLDLIQADGKDDIADSKIRPGKNIEWDVNDFISGIDTIVFRFSKLRQYTLDVAKEIRQTIDLSIISIKPRLLSWDINL